MAEELSRLVSLLESEPALSIEKAAQALRMSVRTLYRRRSEFEHVYKKGHLHFYVRSLKAYIELELYNGTPTHDLTRGRVPDVEAAQRRQKTAHKRNRTSYQR